MAAWSRQRTIPQHLPVCPANTPVIDIIYDKYPHKYQGIKHSSTPEGVKSSLPPVKSLYEGIILADLHAVGVEQAVHDPDQGSAAYHLYDPKDKQDKGQDIENLHIPSQPDPSSVPVHGLKYHKERQGNIQKGRAVFPEIDISI